MLRIGEEVPVAARVKAGALGVAELSCSIAPLNVRPVSRVMPITPKH
jgi:hypothetical protein